MSRRRSAAARRAVCMRVRRVEVVSDASDVGADSDSDDQWTELDDACKCSSLTGPRVGNEIGKGLLNRVFKSVYAVRHFIQIISPYFSKRLNRF